MSVKDELFQKIAEWDKDGLNDANELIADILKVFKRHVKPDTHAKMRPDGSTTRYISREMINELDSLEDE